jgi:hypothetical protein
MPGSFRDVFQSRGVEDQEMSGSDFLFYQGRSRGEKDKFKMNTSSE